jgi:hypothetical protein
MRSQWCREHIDETAEKCGLGEDTVSDVKKAAKFCAGASEFSDCSTASIMALIQIKDEPVRQKAISSVSNALKSGKHPLTGVFLKDKRLPEKTIRKVIQSVEREVRGELIRELTKKYEEDHKSTLEDPNKKPLTQPAKDHPNHGQHVAQPSTLPVTDAPPQPSLAASGRLETCEEEPAPATAEVPKASEEPAVSSSNPTPACHRGEPCPDMHLEKIRGKVCTVLGVPINQLPLNECPHDHKPPVANPGFVHAGTGAPSIATLARMDALKTLNSRNPRELTIAFDDDEWAVLKRVVSEGLAETLEGAVKYIVKDAGERMGGA